MPRKYQVIILLFDNNCGGYDRIVCGRLFNNEHDAEDYIAQIKRGEIVSVIDEFGKLWNVKQKQDYILDMYPLVYWC